MLSSDSETNVPNLEDVEMALPGLGWKSDQEALTAALKKQRDQRQCYLDKRANLLEEEEDDEDDDCDDKLWCADDCGNRDFLEHVEPVAKSTICNGCHGYFSPDCEFQPTEKDAEKALQKGRNLYLLSCVRCSRLLCRSCQPDGWKVFKLQDGVEQSEHEFCPRCRQWMEKTSSEPTQTGLKRKPSCQPSCEKKIKV